MDEAVKQYQRSRAWLYEQVKDGHLKRYEIPGDKRVYLSIVEIEKLLQPREKQD